MIEIKIFLILHHPNSFINLLLLYFFMAVSPPNPRKRKLDYNVDQSAYDEFVKACSRKGMAPQIILEQAMRKFTQTGQI